jgi:RNA polymerase-binding transcription factor DksA
MTYFSCEQCGEMISLSTLDETPRKEYCPVCEESTVWTLEFESEEGVSF